MENRRPVRVSRQIFYANLTPGDRNCPPTKVGKCSQAPGVFNLGGQNGTEIQGRGGVRG